MKNDKNFQIVVILGLCLILIQLTISFSLKSDQLIHISEQNDTVKRNLYFTDLSTAVVGTPTLKVPTINNAALNNFQVVLKNPGDKVYYYFTIVNEKNESYVINDIEKDFHCSANNNQSSEDLCSDLKITLTYDDGTPLQIEDSILDNSTYHVKLGIEYPSYFEEYSIPPITVTGKNLRIFYKNK